MKYFRVTAIFVVGTIFNFLLLAISGAVLGNHFDLPRKYVEARRSAAGYDSLVKAFEAKNDWTDFLAVPVIACLVGTFAGAFESSRPGLLAAACLTSSLCYEVGSQPWHDWPASHVGRYFGMRAVSLILAAAVGASVRKLLARRATIEGYHLRRGE